MRAVKFMIRKRAMGNSKKKVSRTDYKKRIERQKRQRRENLLSYAVAVVVTVILVCALNQGNLRKSTGGQPKPESANLLDVSESETQEFSESASTELSLASAQADADEAFFTDSVLIGDSRAETLGLYSGISSLDMFASKTLDIESVMSSKIAETAEGQQCTVAEYLKTRTYRNIYLSFGLEELNWYKEVYVKRYKSFLDTVTKIQPDAEIYVLSILPVSAELSTQDNVYNNADIDTLNELMREMCDAYENVSYLDITGSVAVDGVLPEDAGIDGVHCNKEYCQKIIEYIRQSVEQM